MAWHRIIASAAGGCWGLLLAIFAAYATGAGHGVFFPLFLISAPMGMLGIDAALLGSVALWCGFAALAHKRSNAFLLLFHYLGIAALCLTEPDFFGGFSHLRGHILTYACLATGLYIVGQMWIVFVTIRAFAQRSHVESATAR